MGLISLASGVKLVHGAGWLFPFLICAWHLKSGQECMVVARYLSRMSAIGGRVCGLGGGESAANASVRCLGVESTSRFFLFPVRCAVVCCSVERARARSQLH